MNVNNDAVFGLDGALLDSSPCCCCFTRPFCFDLVPFALSVPQCMVWRKIEPQILQPYSSSVAKDLFIGVILRMIYTVCTLKIVER